MVEKPAGSPHWEWKASKNMPSKCVVYSRLIDIKLFLEKATAPLKSFCALLTPIIDGLGRKESRPPQACSVGNYFYYVYYTTTGWQVYLGTLHCWMYLTNALSDMTPTTIFHANGFFMHKLKACSPQIVHYCMIALGLFIRMVFKWTINVSTLLSQVRVYAMLIMLQILQ